MVIFHSYVSLPEGTMAWDMVHSQARPVAKIQARQGTTDLCIHL